jgi:xanthine/CO dehydrogenase XdhC/CoxF family maturation factor
MPKPTLCDRGPRACDGVARALARGADHAVVTIRRVDGMSAARSLGLKWRAPVVVATHRRRRDEAALAEALANRRGLREPGGDPPPRQRRPQTR